MKKNTNLFLALFVPVFLALLIPHTQFFQQSPSRYVTVEHALTADQLAYNPPGLVAPTVQNLSDAGDYLDAIKTDSVFRWPAERLPLKVYIEDGSNVPGYQSDFPQILKSAFDAWCRISNGHISWRQVNNPRQADLVCRWTDITKRKGEGVEAGATRMLMETRKGGDVVVRGEISLLTTVYGRPFSHSDMVKTCLHEVGHSLGLQGHSNVPGDIMYPSVNRNQVAYLTERDANTINRLYSDYNDTNTIAAAPTPFSNSYARSDDSDSDNGNDIDGQPMAQMPPRHQWRGRGFGPRMWNGAPQWQGQQGPQWAPQYYGRPRAYQYQYGSQSCDADLARQYAQAMMRRQMMGY